jgi:predicted ester cyclase
MRKALFILPIVLCIMVSCQDKKAQEELDQFKAQDELEARNKELARQMFESWSKGDLETFQNFLASDYVFYYPSGNKNPISKEDIFADSDIVIFRFIQYGTHYGEYMNIPSTGSEIESSGILISRLKNGKVVEQWEEYDALGTMMQLGIELQIKETIK